MTSHPPTAHTQKELPHKSFWDGVKSKTKEGWNKIIPHNLPEMNKEVLADTLDGLIKFLPVTMLWEGREITVSLDNGDTTGDLVSGGILPTGSLTLYLSKSNLPENLYPVSHDTVELLQLNEWRPFSITSVSEPLDQSDPAIIITAEPDNI